MPLAERRERHAASLACLMQNSGNVWSTNFLNSLALTQQGEGVPDDHHASSKWVRSVREPRAASQR
jgi:hypothetical protein